MSYVCAALLWRVAGKGGPMCCDTSPVKTHITRELTADYTRALRAADVIMEISAEHCGMMRLLAISIALVGILLDKLCYGSNHFNPAN